MFEITVHDIMFVVLVILLGLNILLNFKLSAKLRELEAKIAESESRTLR